MSSPHLSSSEPRARANFRGHNEKSILNLDLRIGKIESADLIERHSGEVLERQRAEELRDGAARRGQSAFGLGLPVGSILVQSAFSNQTENVRDADFFRIAAKEI